MPDGAIMSLDPSDPANQRFEGTRVVCRFLGVSKRPDERESEKAGTE
jgi:hypothetical protein